MRAPLAPEDLLAGSPYDEVDDLNDASNAVVELIGKGQLDEAERGAHELLQRYPDAVDGLEHLAYVYERRGKRKKAAETYRKAAAFSLIVDGLEGEIRSHFLAKVQELDPKR